jgi:glycosyltransferase involved in cell wall biosynthesis
MITYCIPTKNNLRYLKNSVESIRKNSSIESYDIVVYIDSDSDGTENWLIENKIKYLKNTETKPKGIAYGYNRCIEAATTEVVCMFHADMYMAAGFDTEILKHLQPGTVVAATRIEPPLHPPGKEKIVRDFGMYPEDFKEDEFNSFVEEVKQSSVNKTTRGIFAPWAVYKSDIERIGLHEEYFHSYHEDSDIFNRFILAGYNILQTWEALVYHLTCRGGQFQDGVEKITQDVEFHKMKSRSARHYIRKWGSWIKNDEYQYPIIAPKYNIAFVVKNCNIHVLEALEPWCDKIYVDDLYDYIEKEQKNTLYDMSKRVLPLINSTPFEDNDIVVEIDAKVFNNQSFNIIQQLPNIIKESGDIGRFELGEDLTVTINKIEELQNNLIKNVQR